MYKIKSTNFHWFSEMVIFNIILILNDTDVLEDKKKHRGN